ncbi:MAG: hypothetical protein LBD50_03175 [Rickettsiales bacterium]|jgi:hypothetical protein|nr:hypothetical protein [Rickettsiales bacterium]
MKKIILSGLFAGFVFAAANASDTGGLYKEQSVSTTRISARYDTVYYAGDAYSAPKPKCARAADAPIRVKTHTEVIDHYQVYRPVIIYAPAGKYSERRVIKSNARCGACGL